MNKQPVLLGLMLFPLFCAVAVPAQVKTAKPSASSRQSAAGAAARNQLSAYLADFQNHPDDPTLRSEIVALAKTITPAPPISSAARNSFAQATARMKTASTADDFKAAAKLFEQAAVQAPWYADSDYNAATARAQAADFDGARRNLEFYRSAVRPGVDTHSAENLLNDIDNRLATQQLQQALRQFAANPDNTARLQVIRLVQAMKTPPEIPEEAREHYVMASVLANSVEDNPSYAKRAVEEYNAALLAAPWWADVYKKLATVQTIAGQYDNAIASQAYYLLLRPAEARSTQDEIYRLKALGQKAADDETLIHAREQKHALRMEQQQEQRTALTNSNFTVEGRWYATPTPNHYFAGGESNPECDYLIKRDGERWTIANSCSRRAWIIEDVEVQARILSFRIMGHDSTFPFGEVAVTFTLSSDGQKLEGQTNAYDKTFNTLGSHPARWTRRN